MSIVHDYPIEVDPTDMDHMGHVNNAVYLRWVQDVIVRHWRRLALPDAIAAHLWVALKHEITYRKPAFLRDEIFASVSLERIAGACAHFQTMIRRGQDSIAEVHSIWCALDATTRKPRRLRAEIIAPFMQAPVAN